MNPLTPLPLLHRLTLSFLLSCLLASLCHAADYRSDWPEHTTRHWAGAEFWANRLQDWQVNHGRLECVTRQGGFPMRTVHLLTHRVEEGEDSFTLQVRTGSMDLVDPDRDGWSGFLLGAGEGELNPNSATLVHSHPGEGGGIIAGFDQKGRARFRLNTDTTGEPIYPQFEGAKSSDKDAQPRDEWEDVELTLTARPNGDGTFQLTLVAADYLDGTELSRTELNRVPAKLVRGNLALISHDEPSPGRPHRFWFRDFRVSGPGVQEEPARRLGPIMGTLYFVSAGTLKLTAQFVPLGFGDSRDAELWLKSAEGTWRHRATETIQPHGYSANFRLPEWDANRPVEFSVRYSDGGTPVRYDGIIAAHPAVGESVDVAAVTCFQIIGQPADNGWGFNKAGSAGRWTQPNIWFGNLGAAKRMLGQGADMGVFLGDQVYEGGNPTNSDFRGTGRNPELDYLYKWFNFLREFGEFTRQRPSILLTDDHDVFQGDLWGASGARTRNGNAKDGGYTHEAGFVRMVERTQTWHNPDTPTPILVEQDIGVYYTSFRFGGIDFAVLEDRKFKSLPGMVKNITKDRSKIANENYDPRDADVPGAELLGQTQLAFLRDWLGTGEPDGPRVVLTQTMWSSLHTQPDQKPWIDLDSNGWPQSARNRALNTMAPYPVLMIGGDTHLAALVRHGTEQWDDAPWQFVVPAVANKYRRWWLPGELPEGYRNGEPTYLGRHLDGFDNKINVVAVGNPLIHNAEVAADNDQRGYYDPHAFLDRTRTWDGFGMVRLKAGQPTATVEAWTTNQPIDEPDRQIPGWPVELDLRPKVK
ncbi:MAG: hypothetical protein SynsKO_40870 [Synoicihabitans sp.]